MLMLATTVIITLHLTFPYLQVDHNKVVCEFRDFLGLRKLGLEC